MEIISTPDNKYPQTPCEQNNKYKPMTYRNLTVLLNFTDCLVVFVLKEKPSAEISPRPYPKLSVGDELRLTCEVNKATVKVIWKKDDTVNPRTQIDTQLDHKLSKLVVERVVEGDSGEYSCEAHNQPGIVDRSAVKIIVRGKVTFALFGRE